MVVFVPLGTSKKMKKIILLLLLLLVYGNSFCQEDKKFAITGRVLSGINHKPIKQASVFIRSTSAGAATDSLGYFMIPEVVKGRYTLEVSWLGYIDLDTVVVVDSVLMTPLEIVLDAACPVNRQVALADIGKGEPRLLLVGGIAPVVVLDQHQFEKKYKVYYYDFGCTPPAYECIEEYNKTIFEHLDKKYGQDWRKKV